MSKGARTAVRREADNNAATPNISLFSHLSSNTLSDHHTNPMQERLQVKGTELLPSPPRDLKEKNADGVSLASTLHHTQRARGLICTSRALATPQRQPMCFHRFVRRPDHAQKKGTREQNTANGYGSHFHSASATRGTWCCRVCAHSSLIFFLRLVSHSCASSGQPAAGKSSS